MECVGYKDFDFKMLFDYFVISWKVMMEIYMIFVFLIWRLDKILEIKIKNNYNLFEWFWILLKYIKNL